jgi:exodeoxyribonuclease VII small subunit
MSKTTGKKPTDTDADAEASTETVNFEAALEELEQLVAKMEGGELTLDESLQAFERGVKLTRQCQAALQQAELKVQALTEGGALTSGLDPLEEPLDDA